MTSVSLEHALKKNGAYFGVSASDIKRSLKWAENNSMICISDRDLFRVKYADMPEYIFAQGNTDILDKERVLIVGSRKPDTYGMEMTRKLVRSLDRDRQCTISGFALGIDSIVHNESVKCGIQTAAVPGAGLAVNYPSMNRALRNDVMHKGLFLSEMPPYVRPRKHFFIRRNILMTALADKVIIIQGTAKSGTLNTMNTAFTMGRQVFALPGNINNPLSFVPNHAVSRGADIITGVETAVKASLDADEILFLRAAFKYADINEIISYLPFEKDKIMSIITRLEIKGVIRRGFNNTIIITEDFDGQPDTKD